MFTEEARHRVVTRCREATGPLLAELCCFSTHQLIFSPAESLILLPPAAHLHDLPALILLPPNLGRTHN